MNRGLHMKHCHTW